LKKKKEKKEKTVITKRTKVIKSHFGEVHYFFITSKNALQGVNDGKIETKDFCPKKKKGKKEKEI